LAENSLKDIKGTDKTKYDSIMNNLTIYASKICEISKSENSKKLETFKN
jgi:hypothetical protein